MRPYKALLLCFLCITGFMHAQIAVTFYVIPPVNGCDGVWALDNNTLWCGDTWAVTDTTPSGGPCCPVSGWVTSNDTTYIPLCSLPCSIVFIDMITAMQCGSANTPATLNANTLLTEEKYYGFPSVLKMGGY